MATAAYTFEPVRMMTPLILPGHGPSAAGNRRAREAAVRWR